METFIFDSQGYAGFQGICRSLTAGFYPTLPRKVGFCAKALSNYGLLVSESLLSGFKIPTVIPSIYLCLSSCKLNKLISKSIIISRIRTYIIINSNRTGIIINNFTNIYFPQYLLTFPNLNICSIDITSEDRS